MTTFAHGATVPSWGTIARACEALYLNPETWVPRTDRQQRATSVRVVTKSECPPPCQLEPIDGDVERLAFGLAWAKAEKEGNVSVSGEFFKMALSWRVCFQFIPDVDDSLRERWLSMERLKTAARSNELIGYKRTLAVMDVVFSLSSRGSL